VVRSFVMNNAGVFHHIMRGLGVARL